MPRSLLPVAVACAALSLAACRSGGEQSLAPRFGEPPLGEPLRVTESLAISPGRYVRPPVGEGAVILLEGLAGVTLDLREVELLSAEPGALPPPDERRGCAVLLRDSSDVRVLGGTLRGYHDGLVLERCRDVLVEGLVVEDYFAQRLASTSAASHPADQLALEVARGEDWLRRYGAGVALVDCSRVTVSGLRARGGQNGVLLARSDNCEVLDADLAFLSGWGAALWRAVDCTVARCRLDACARGRVAGGHGDSFGSAGLIVAGPPGGNVLAWNTAVGCGAGGRVVGGSATPAPGDLCDLWLENDLRAALGASLVLEGARSTRVVRNLLGGGGGAGLVARGASGLLLHGNRVEDAAGAGIALHDSQLCVVAENHVLRADRGVELSSSAEAAHASRGHWIVGNRLDDNVQDLVLERCEELVVARNSFSTTAPTRHLEELRALDAPGLEAPAVWERLRGADGSAPSGRAWRVSLRPEPELRHPELLAIEALGVPQLAGGAARPAPAADGPPLLGRYGPWDPTSGAPPPAPPAPGGLLAAAEWDAVWFTWDAGCDPRGDQDAWRARRFEPVARATVRGWGDPWGGAERRAQVGAERFGLIASASFELEEEGVYLLALGSDDGLRVTLDGRLVHEDWTWHAERHETVELELSAGRHAIGLEYFQESGAAALKLSLDRRPTP